jgi:outer membrane protein assembly factor BamB
MGARVQPAVAGGVVFVGDGGGFVRAFDAAGCGGPFRLPSWLVGLGAITGAPAVSNGQLYVGTQDGHLVAFRLPST